MAILSKFFSLFLALALLVTAAVNFYIVYLLGQVPLDVGKVRKTSILTAVGILVLILLLIFFFVFAGIVAKNLFRGKAGLFSIFVLLILGVVMGLDFAIPPALKRAEIDENDIIDVDRARLFAIIAASFGTLLFLITLIYFIIRISKSARVEKLQKQATVPVENIPTEELSEEASKIE